MKDFFKDKVVWITGSSKGIGKATALLLGEWGARIVLNGRSEDTLQATLTQLKEQGIDSIALPGDISRHEQCGQMVDKIISHYGRLDILINNAGVASMGLFSDTLPETWERVIAINTLGPIYSTKYSLPHLLRSGGSVIFISSLGGKVGLPGHSTYSVSKMALTSLTRALQIEFSKKELHTGILYVGFTENEPDKKIMTPDGKYLELNKRDYVKTAKREKVAESIARMIFHRRKRKTLSGVGHIQKIIGSIFPDVIDLILKRQHKKNFQSMYSSDGK